jgi:tRNA-dihydrouridine synthase
MKNFWIQLQKPFFALAPMEDVTDTVFRELIASISAPGKLHIVFTEFMSVDGFLHPKGNDKVRHRLYVSDSEQKILKEKGIKIVAQIWGSDPEKYYKAAKQIAEDYSFDGIDINMGCPVNKIVKHNSCSALIKFPELAQEIISATQNASDLPVSVKTRIGINDVVTEEWISSLLEVSPAAISVHGRTQKMQSEGLADWNEVRKAVEIRNAISPRTRILGNGDVLTYNEGLEKASFFGVDGIMVGRGIFANPGFFADSDMMDHSQRMDLLKKHLLLFEEQWSGRKHFAILKRFFKIYVHSFDGATEMRLRLMETKHVEEALKVLEEAVIGRYSRSA